MDILALFTIEVMIMKKEIIYEGDKERALKDAKDWMTKKQWDTIVGMIKGGCSDNLIHMGGLLAGCQGYPIDCMIEKYRS